MDDKTKTQVVILQVLALAGMFLGRLPRVQQAVELLTGLVQDHWEEIWSIAKKKVQNKKIMAVADEADGSVCWPEGAVRDTMERIEDEFGPEAGGKKKAEGSKPAGTEDGKGKKKAFRH